MATKKQMQSDISFLVERQMKASGFTLGEDRDRDTGMSSNSIVGIAYGYINLSDQYFPGDVWDMKSCENMWRKLPEHRKKGDALKAMNAARASNYYGKTIQ